MCVGPKSATVRDCGGDGRSVYHADTVLFLIGGVIPALCDCASIARIPISEDFAEGIETVSKEPFILRKK